MARSRSRAGAASTRQTKATSRKRAASTSSGTVEVVEENEGPGIDTGIVVVTFVLLAAAFLFVDRGLGQLFGEGLFFK